MATVTLTKAKERDSNMELLRIICMLLILVHHFIIVVLYPNLTTHGGEISYYRIACIIINGFAYVGVNCFILISGYYGIKFRIKSLFNLYCVCAFYTVLTSLMKYGLTDLPLNKGFFYSVFLPFSHSEWWFIKCYVALFLVSPLLNKAVHGLAYKEFVCSLVLLTVLNVYWGFYWHEHNINGYNLEQFIFVYFIGAFLRKFPPKLINRKRSLLLYISGALIWSIVTIISVKWRVPHWVSFHYNNPFVLIAAVGLFLYLTGINIHNPCINILASSALAAYLLQDAPIYSLASCYNRMFIDSLDSEMLRVLSMVTFVLIGSILVYVFSFVIDRIRLLLMQPIWKLYDWSSSHIKNFQFIKT